MRLEFFCNLYALIIIITLEAIELPFCDSNPLTYFNNQTGKGPNIQPAQNLTSHINIFTNFKTNNQTNMKKHRCCRLGADLKNSTNCSLSIIIMNQKKWLAQGRPFTMNQMHMKKTPRNITSPTNRGGILALKIMQQCNRNRVFDRIFIQCCMRDPG
eukprot:TCONS_00067797-protein